MKPKVLQNTTPRLDLIQLIGMLFWLVVYLPLWKIRKSVGMILSNIWTKICSKPPTSFVCSEKKTTWWIRRLRPEFRWGYMHDCLQLHVAVRCTISESNPSGIESNPSTDGWFEDIKQPRTCGSIDTPGIEGFQHVPLIDSPVMVDFPCSTDSEEARFASWKSPRIFPWSSPFLAGWWLSHPSDKYEFVSWDDEIPNMTPTRPWNGWLALRWPSGHLFPSPALAVTCNKDYREFKANLAFG